MSYTLLCTYPDFGLAVDRFWLLGVVCVHTHSNLIDHQSLQFLSYGRNKLSSLTAAMKKRSSSARP